ncbi:MAG TPA: sulfurtransferase TusA family protein [bacterium]|nr:sulfurtransferase TusA family protein [bacterium]
MSATKSADNDSRRGGDAMSTERPTRRLDLRGSVCPGPTYDTRMTLNEMAAGEILEVVTDYYPAKQTIPALMQELGYPCELKDVDQAVFRVIIQKA